MTASAESLRGAVAAPVQSKDPSVLRRLLKQRLVPQALIVLGIIVFVAAFAPLIAPHDPALTNPRNGLAGPSLDHLLGTDRLGRDVLSRLMYGSRISVQVGIIAVGVAITVGIPLGIIAAWFGGVWDTLIMRAMDAIIAFPSIIMALAFIAIFGQGIVMIMIAIGLNSVPFYARLIRGQVLSVREEPYVSAARTIGADNLRIIRLHLLPNSISPIIVQGSLGVGTAILAEAGLSFLGLGVAPPTATWGGMLSEALSLIRVAPELAMAPGMAIFVTVLAINTVGDALRDVLDPRLRGSR